MQALSPTKPQADPDTVASLGMRETILSHAIGFRAKKRTAKELMAA